MRPFEPSHLYIQVKNELAKRIARDEYPPGSLLPNEFFLASEMQVSVGTVRKALTELGAEQLVNRSPGRGTVVADRQSAQFRGKFDRVRSANGAPIVWKFRAVHTEIRRANEEEIHVLRLKEGDEVIAIRRMRETAGQVIKHEYVRLPFAVFGPIDDLEPHETVIENLAFLRGVHIASSDERLRLVVIPEEIAEGCGIPAETMVLRLDRLVLGSANEPIEWRIAYCHLGDRQYSAPSPLGAK